MLSWALPTDLWIGAAILPVIFFYFLRMRFRDQPFSSIYIWSRLQKITRSGSRLRWRSILLLLLQIGAVLAVVAVIARPSWISRRLTEPGTIFLLDVSASMAAMDEIDADGRSISRLEKARLLMEQEIRNLPPHSYGAVFLCASGITQLEKGSSDHSRLLAGLKGVQPSGAGFIENRVAAEIKAWLQTEKRPWQACLITDGGLDLNGRELTGVFRGAWRTVMVGRNGNDLGVTGLRLLPGPRAQFLVYNGKSRTEKIKVTLKFNEKPIITTRLEAAPGVTRRILPFGGTVRPGIYEVESSATGDNLTWDNSYRLALNPQRRFRVLLIGATDPFLNAALRDPRVQLARLPQFPASGLTGSDWDLVVADRVKIPAGLQVNLLAIGTIPEGAPVRLGPSVSGVLTGIDTSHPLARFVDWGSVRVGGGNSLEIASNVQPLATVGGQPIMAVWEQAGYRSVVIGTDLFHSDLALSGAFPVFFQNLLLWCVPQAANSLAYNLTVGEPVSISEGRDWRFLDTRGIRVVRNGSMLSLRAETTGVFRWQSGKTKGVLVSNIAPSELQIGPRILVTQKSKVLTAAGYEVNRQSLADYFTLLFLILLCLEWICWSGGWRMIKE